MAAVDLATARAALAHAETKLGVRRAAPAAFDTDDPEPISSLLTSSPAGNAHVVAASTTLLLALLAAHQGRGSIAVAGCADLGWVAAHEAGIDLDRTAYVPVVAHSQPQIAAAMLDGFEQVVLGDGIALTDADKRRLSARARDTSATIWATTAWPGAAHVLETTARAWHGTDDGHGHLRAATLTVERTGRGAAARPARFEVALPAAGDCVREISAAPARLRLVS
ncbi:hypothetical protein GCM10025865_33850 (plasmid) [Paraoerskovia sediminicola]|uniref:Protein ImuA n=1 Tax=Paraoerskovia sediminicola TaxID=1138587 RepID=A0ABN6XKG3_9CELL|nr:hypothetical protein [Paraoerskovia sediminicola]BDZ44042.1 hypothetical protein GCM10025865_33410 [Paraoerskovia sediminicola]BDZ44086.1 hypothetical protein GCM10025865_33850 [Paraoerskovia sediminicola]